MSKLLKPHVKLSTPEKGWITFSLSLSNHEFTEQFWHVPVDFVANLISAVTSIAEGQRTTVAEASAESNGRYLFEFMCLSDMDTLKLVIRHWPSWTSRTTGGTVVFESDSPRLDLLRAFWRGFQSLRGRCDGAAFESAWGAPLETRAIDSLGHRVGGRR